MKLLYVYVTLGEPRLVVGVDDEKGKIRRVDVKWMAGPIPDAELPPKTWADSARGEVDYQISIAANPDPLRRFR